MAHVSVIMPCFNNAAFIEDAVESVCRQGYTDWDLCIVDDCSTDKTFDIAKTYAQRDPRIRVDRMPNNTKIPARVRNHAARMASGKFLAFLDADDYWMPEKLEEQVACFHDHPETGLVFGPFQIKSGLHRFDGKRIQPAGDIDWSRSVYDRLIRFNFMTCSSVMIDRAAVEENFLFDERPDFAFIEDWDLWLRIAKKKRFGFIPQTLGVYRMHESNSSWDPKRLERPFAVIDKHLAVGLLDREAADQAKVNFYFTLAWSIIQDDAPKAGELFLQGRRTAKIFSKGFWVNSLGACLAKFPRLCRWIKTHSIDRKVGKLFFNVQKL